MKESLFKLTINAEKCNLIKKKLGSSNKSTDSTKIYIICRRKAMQPVWLKYTSCCIHFKEIYVILYSICHIFPIEKFTNANI